MAHLVASVTAADGQRVPIGECYRLVKEARDFLAHRGSIAIAQAGSYAGTASWGTDVKRLRVELPHEHRPQLVGPALTRHNLIEVINQCAGMERLLDALQWAQEALPGYAVERCHPTTGSTALDGRKVADDHDLVLIGSCGEKAKFEVSDVVGSQDSNRKEQKDLLSLGIPLSISS